ncbi:MAG TPA: SGNH/GDSL hydrolase family protein [Myxococcota bacterium]|nr:SGNH/GDSL hydrolase family protein [Myxococcota bacterium]
MRRIAFVALTLCLSFGQPAFAASFDSLISFGDSLSDTGSGPATPPGYGGRFSNGPVWEEYLASSLAIPAASTKDYAIGGATSGTGNVNGTTTGLLTQVSGFVAAPDHLGSSTLYTVWAGGNDAIAAALGGGDPVAAANQAAINIASAITQLAGTGAQYFLVPNLPNGGLLPLAAQVGADPTQANLLSLYGNAQLDAALAPLASALGITIYRADVYTLFQAMVANPAAYGLSDVVDPCKTSSSTCANPDQYLFWDSIHPTTVVHSFIGQLALAALPEPEVLALVVALLALSSRFARTAASRRG